MRRLICGTCLLLGAAENRSLEGRITFRPTDLWLNVGSVDDRSQQHVLELPEMCAWNVQVRSPF